MTAPPVIEIKEISFAYGEPPVLENIQLSVAEGEFLGIVGPNAGGKSTLLKLILGLLPPKSGQIRVLGRSPIEASHRIGYVPQYPSFNRDFPISVEQVVAMGRLGGNRRHWLLPSRYSATDRQAVSAALREVEASDLSRRQINSLSGGQMQRILLARALVSQPEILILDEPTANIDQRMEGEIFDLLQQLNQRLTILVVSHDIAFISAYVSRVACINRSLVCHQTDAINGQIIQDLYGEPIRMVTHGHGR